MCREIVNMYLSWIFDKVAPEKFGHFERNEASTGVLCFQSASEPHERERKRKGKRAKEKKGMAIPIIFQYYLIRGVSFTKIQVDI